MTWKLVPIEPTEEMLKAACEAALSTEVLLDDTRFSCDRAGYAAAIAAAPAAFPQPLSNLIERCERYARIIEGIIVVHHDKTEHQEPKETLLEAAAILKKLV